MAESFGEAKKPEAAAASSPVEYLFHRRIEFHPARKPYSPIASAGGNFHLETLNPTSDALRPAPSPGGPAAASLVNKFDSREFYENGLDPELSFRITFRRIVSRILFWFWLGRSLEFIHGERLVSCCFFIGVWIPVVSSLAFGFDV